MRFSRHKANSNVKLVYDKKLSISIIINLFSQLFPFPLSLVFQKPQLSHCIKNCWILILKYLHLVRYSFEQLVFQPLWLLKQKMIRLFCGSCNFQNIDPRNLNSSFSFDSVLLCKNTTTCDCFIPRRVTKCVYLLQNKIVYLTVNFYSLLMKLYQYSTSLLCCCPSGLQTKITPLASFWIAGQHRWNLIVITVHFHAFSRSFKINKHYSTSYHRCNPIVQLRRRYSCCWFLNRCSRIPQFLRLELADIHRRLLLLHRPKSSLLYSFRSNEYNCSQWI